MAELVVALDFPEKKPALALARQLQGSVSWLKVGLELFTACGPELVSQLKSDGFQVFVDLKFLDIPNTVAGAVSSVCRTGADMLTVHVCGGQDMVRAAVEARNKTDKNCRLMGVTVLTSWDEKSFPWPESRPVGDVVTDFANKANNWQLDGVVCSGYEVRHLKNKFPHLQYITPGIRPQMEKDDQKRVVTPKQAVADGSDFLVMGRPVTQAPSPREAVRFVLRQLTNQRNKGEKNDRQ